MRKNPITLRLGEGYSLEDVIKAVRDLLYYYTHPREGDFDGVDCPFCDLFFGCKQCLWYVFHHMECDDVARKMFGTDVAELKRYKRWRAFRIKELRCWFKELKRPGVKVVKY